MQRYTNKNCQKRKNVMRPLLVVLSLVLIITSCKKNRENKNGICFTRTSTELKIENNSNEDYYFVGFGQNILPLIDWAPICGNNNIPPRNSVNSLLSSITGYSDYDLLVVYWWKCTGTTPGEIEIVVLNRNQSACR
jgi:hypothetical protein